MQLKKLYILDYTNLCPGWLLAFLWFVKHYDERLEKAMKQLKKIS